MILWNKNLRVRSQFCWFNIILFFFTINITYAQNIQSGDVLKLTGNITNQINKTGDKAKAMYAENIDNPYIPTKINNEYTVETAKEKLTLELDKYVNYYWASKVAAYKNLNTNISYKKIYNPIVTDEYIFFRGEKNKNSNDTVYIHYKDIINSQIIYYVKIADNGFYTAYVKIGEHLITCRYQHVADLIFYLQHQFALKYYEDDLERFKTITANYQKLSVKPEISEGQRKLFIQGNTMVENNFVDAMALYEKAIALNPISSPTSYYNYALIAAMAEKYELAILNMKKYILLLPSAEDLRTAQDKIYEWETFIKK